LYFGKLPFDLDPEQVQDYLFYLQKKSKTPSQTYFKHTVYGLLFLLKGRSALLRSGRMQIVAVFHERGPPIWLSEVGQDTIVCK
jgi:hypothetical protein